jgi:hypothetical protein
MRGMGGSSPFGEVRRGSKGKDLRPKSQIPNSKSQIPNSKFQIQNPKERII